MVQKLKEKEEGFEYVVVEGNTRLTIYKQFHEDGIKENDYNNQWQKIPCEIINDPDPKLLHQIQLAAHIVPAKPWGPYERAKYLHYLKQEGTIYELSQTDLIEICGGSSRKNTIEKEIAAYEHMQKWHKIDKQEMLEYNPVKFQYFFQYQLRKSRLEGIDISEDVFVEHIAKDLIDQARHVQKLDLIWKNPTVDPTEECKKIYLEEGSEAALMKLAQLEKTKKIVESNDILKCIPWSLH